MLLPPAPRESSKKVHYPLQVHPKLGKLSSPSLEEASCDGPKPQHRLFVTDASTGTQYLVDTGAEISVLPKHFLGTLCQPIEGNTLFAANNTSIQVYGSKLLIVDLKTAKNFQMGFHSGRRPQAHPRCRFSLALPPAPGPENAETHRRGNTPLRNW
jgi:hypothetical protein